MNNNKKTGTIKHELEGKLFSSIIENIYFLLRWFEPFVMQWLNENDDMSMEYLHNALEKDRQTGVNIFLC